jgi:guanylate kinase
MVFNPGAGRLFVISGPSGAGKGTVIREVLKRRPDIQLSVSATTRPARPHERNGVDYTFISVPQFLGMRDRGDFLESAEVYGNFYGTPRGQVDASIARGKSVILELDIQGALSVKRGKPDAVLIFIEPPSLDELFLRLRGRGTEETENLSERMRAAYEELKNKGIYDYIVINDDLGRATDELVRIIEEKERNSR